MSEQKLATILRNLIEDRPVSEPEMVLAQKKIRSMLAEAQEFGFSEADVIKAVVGQVWTPEPECGCPQCGLKYQTSGTDLTGNGAPR